MLPNTYEADEEKVRTCFRLKYAPVVAEELNRARQDTPRPDWERALKTIRDDYDHEEQTHDHQPFIYGGECRKCLAERVLAGASREPTPPPRWTYDEIRLAAQAVRLAGNDAHSGDGLGEWFEPLFLVEQVAPMLAAFAALRSRDGEATND